MRGNGLSATIRTLDAESLTAAITVLRVAFLGELGVFARNCFFAN